VTLNVGQDFKKRWLNAPEVVRQTLVDDLNRICDLLNPTTDLQSWLDNDHRKMQIAQLQVDQAHAELKAQLIEAARIRKQIALEKSLTEKRAIQDAYNQNLLKDEAKQFAVQTLSLIQLKSKIDCEITQYSARFTQNPPLPSIDYANGSFKITDEHITSELETVRLRLELEAETLIEQQITLFRTKLENAAKEEIEYILTNSTFSKNKA